MRTCPSCRQTVAASDDVCENCGAILTQITVAPRLATTSQPTATSAHSVPVATVTPTVCPNCKHALQPGEDVCENCGLVVSGALLASTSRPISSTTTQTSNLCPRCHKAYKSNARFCNGCGYRFPDSTSAPATSASVMSTPQTDPLSRLSVGQILNSKYKIVKEIGAGGMGAVFLAEDTVLKRQVVIKALLSEDDPDLVEQSVKEREFLAAIKHANIVSIYDFITMNRKGYIVMEYVHGQTLEDLLLARGKPLPVAEAIGYILGILPAFAYLAKLDLVYCDFKPQNMMVEQLKDGNQIVKLIDMGTVIKYEPRPKDVYGTHGFYAPEAVKHPSSQTDLYSICRTLAYLVSLMDLANPMFGMPIVENYRVFRDYPALYRLLVKGTHSKPEQRFQSADELADQLRGVLRQIVGGKASEPIASRLFAPGILTTTGKLGFRGEAALDEGDPVIDTLRYGDQALRAGNYIGARGFYNQATRNNQRSLDAHLRLAEVYIDQGEYSLALSEVTLAQRLSPSHWKISWYTGRLLEAQERYNEASAQYRELIAELPGELPPQLALARVNNRMQQHQAAVDLYSAVLKADPANTEAVLGATDSLMKLQRWSDAATLLDGVNEAAARYIESQLLLINIYIQHMQPIDEKNVQKAATVVTALEGRTEDSRYFLARGHVYRTAWELAKRGALAKGTSLPGVSECSPRTLGSAAEHSYKEYLRRASHPADREQVVKYRLQAAPWRWW